MKPLIITALALAFIFGAYRIGNTIEKKDHKDLLQSYQSRITHDSTQLTNLRDSLRILKLHFDSLTAILDSLPTTTSPKHP